MANHFELELQASYMLAPEVRHLVFKRVDASVLPFIPGQFLQVHFSHADTPTKRSYSLASTPGAELLEIAVSYVDGGAATRLFANLQHGEQIQASGPYGRFCLMDADRNSRYLLVGTGTGITPYRAMLPRIAELIATRGLKVALIQGARTEDELLYGEEFAAFATAHPNFSYFACLSRGYRANKAGDRHGRVQVVFDELQLDPALDIAYLCGNPIMVDESFTKLKELGFAVSAVRREKYVSSK